MLQLQQKPFVSSAAAEVVAKAQAVLSEPELLRAMFDVGYFPPNTPPDEWTVFHIEISGARCPSKSGSAAGRSSCYKADQTHER
jgi:hypothetical protein